VTSDSTFMQDGYRVRVSWDQHGARDAAKAGHIVVVIDCIDFSSAVTTATAVGAVIYPSEDDEKAKKKAAEIGGVAAVPRQDVPNKGKYSISCHTLLTAPAGEKIVLPSPNGSFDTIKGRKAPCLLIGSLLNARAVAETVKELLATTTMDCTIVPCGERWPTKEEFRVDFEDELTASAILNFIGIEDYFSPEATICAANWKVIGDRYEELLLECGSARKVRNQGFQDDLEWLAQLNKYDVVPELCGDHFIPRGH
jgi:2-phosphosulfolactate phosphatase